MITKNELLEMIKPLNNAQDKLMIAGAFFGLYGGIGYDTITGLKKSDVNFEKNTIMVEGAEVEIDKDLAPILKEAMNQTIYHKLGAVGGHSSSDYRLNTSSEYIINTLPTARNKNGTAQMSYQGAKARVRAIIAELGVKISLAEIKQSGAYHLLTEKKFNWTVDEASVYLKEHSLGMQRSSIAKLVKNIKTIA